MGAMIEISLYSYLYPKLAKMLFISYYLLCFLFNKIGEEAEQVLSGSKLGPGPKMYAHMNKCINNKKQNKKKPSCSIE
jgi:hypothetical protein